MSRDYELYADEFDAMNNYYAEEKKSKQIAIYVKTLNKLRELAEQIVGVEDDASYEEYCERISQLSPEEREVEELYEALNNSCAVFKTLGY